MPLVVPPESLHENDSAINGKKSNVVMKETQIPTSHVFHGQSNNPRKEIDEPQDINSSPEPPAIPLHSNYKTAAGTTSSVLDAISDARDMAGPGKSDEKSSNTSQNIIFPQPVPFPKGNDISHRPAVGKVIPQPMPINVIQIDYASDSIPGKRSELPTPKRHSRANSPEYRDHMENSMRVRKSNPRRKARVLDVSDRSEKTTHPATTNEGLSQQDLLTILMFRIQQDKRARDAEKAAELMKDTELDESKLAYRDLEARLQFMLSKEKEQSARLQSMTAKEKEQEAQLKKYQNALPGWKSNIQKLEGYLYGLTNDHNKLRDDAVAIRKQQESLQVEKSAIHDALKETHAITRHETDGRTKIVTEAKSLICVLEQTIHNQTIQLNEKQNLLNHERERNNSLEISVSRASKDHQQMMDCLNSYRQEVSSKLDELVNANQTTLAKSKAEENDRVRSMLDQCLATLGELENKQSVKPEDLRLLHSSIWADVERYVPTVEPISK